jgi:uncharacterized membrane protein (UPF0127 family)
MLPGAVSWVATALAISVLQLGVAASSAYQSANLTATTIAVGGISVTVEIADEPAERAHGLADRDGLAPGTGMIFVFSESGPRSFWMKGMRFCLDMVWIEQGTILGATTNVCPTKGLTDADLPTYRSPAPVSYVLEMPAGWVDANGFGFGTPVEYLPPLSAT